MNKNESSRYINIDAIIKQANIDKGDLLNKKEVPSDIDSHPIDKVDILVATCTEKNCEEIIKSLKEIFKNNAGGLEKLTEELFIQIEDQNRIARSEEKKCDSIQDMEAKALAKSKWINKRRSLSMLSRTFDRRGEKRGEDNNEE